jgi:hypothetical protein
MDMHCYSNTRQVRQGKQIRNHLLVEEELLVV